MINQINALKKYNTKNEFLLKNKKIPITIDRDF